MAYIITEANFYYAWEISMSMDSKYTGPAREADKQFDAFAKYRQQRRHTELEVVRDVYTPKINPWGLPLKKKI
jgi:hypothetical protein